MAGHPADLVGGLPIAVIIGVFSGIMLGIPVLQMRGDYLAIVTLGFGEIIRLIFLSDWLKPLVGGSNGITRIPKAVRELNHRPL
jgi:branched-chain amino acid transport system permease protein